MKIKILFQNLFNSDFTFPQSFQDDYLALINKQMEVYNYIIWQHEDAPFTRCNDELKRNSDYLALLDEEELLKKKFIAKFPVSKKRYKKGIEKIIKIFNDED